MKSTGIVRKIDALGRIVLPISLREAFDLEDKDSVEIFTDDNMIVLKKYQPSCIFCNNVDNIVVFNDKKICSECLGKIKKL